jgi:hypothetical protein
MIVFAVIVATLIAGQTSATAARPHPSVPTYPAAVQHELDTIKANGGVILSVVGVPYTRTTETGPATPTFTSKHPSVVTPDGFPSGCGLFVTIWRTSGEVTSDSLTSCSSIAAELQMYGGIGRLRFYGWETMATNEIDETFTYGDTMYINYNCTGTGKHNFQAITNGYVEINGEEYHADAYDEIDNQTCPS